MPRSVTAFLLLSNNCAFEFLGLPFSFPRRVVYCICSNFLSKQCSDLQCHLEVKGAVEPSLTNKWKKVTNLWNYSRLVRSLHSLPLHGTRFAHWSIWSDPSVAAGQSWRIQELFLHRSCVTQESCGTEMTHYTKKHVVDYCSACGVVHVVVQCVLHYEYLQEKCVSAER